jgi:hypothetical protein
VVSGTATVLPSFRPPARPPAPCDRHTILQRGGAVPGALLTVPAWSQLGWNAPSLSEWWTHMGQRHAQLAPWVGNQPPKAVWLAGLFRPATFLQLTVQVGYNSACRRPLIDCVAAGLYAHARNDADLGEQVGQVACA